MKEKALPDSNQHYLRHTPVFKVLMPVFNREKTVKRAIDSLRVQTFQDFCLVVIDDCSSDNSLSVAVDSARRIQCPSVFIRIPENIGVGAALNTGVNAECCVDDQWIVRLDSDDMYAPDYLENRYKAIRNHPDVELFYGGMQVLNGSDTVPDAQDMKRRILVSDTSQGATLVVRSDVFARIGGFDNIRYGEDHSFLEKARMQNVRIKRLYLSDYYYYRDAENSLTLLTGNM